MCYNFWGITFFSLLRQALEREAHLIVEPHIQDEHRGLHSGHIKLDKLFTFLRLLESVWEFIQAVYMCFVNMGPTVTGCSIPVLLQ